MTVKIEFEVELPDVDHTEDQLEDFIRYETGDNGELRGDNPFNITGASFEPVFGTLNWEYYD